MRVIIFTALLPSPFSLAEFSFCMKLIISSFIQHLVSAILAFFLKHTVLPVCLDLAENLHFLVSQFRGFLCGILTLVTVTSFLQVFQFPEMQVALINKSKCRCKLKHEIKSVCSWACWFSIFSYILLKPSRGVA